MRRAVFLLATLLLTLAAIYLLLQQSPQEPVSTPVPADEPPPVVAPPVVPPPAPPAPAAPRQTVQKVVVSGIPLRIVRRAAITVPTGALVATYARLEQEARSGNSVSQYQLGLVLYECRDVPADKAALDAEVESIYQTRRHHGWNVQSPADEVRTLHHRYGNCEGIPAAARGQFRDELKAAADAGVIEALINLPLKLPEAEYCQYLSECTPEQRDAQAALQKEAIDYVDRARDAGSVAALWTIGGWYVQGEVLPQNDIEAYAHFRALDQINAAAGLPQRFGQMLGGLKRRLRPIDLEQAETRAKALLSNPNCCVITP